MSRAELCSVGSADRESVGVRVVACSGGVHASIAVEIAWNPLDANFSPTAISPGPTNRSHEVRAGGEGYSYRSPSNIVPQLTNVIAPVLVEVPSHKSGGVKPTA